MSEEDLGECPLCGRPMVAGRSVDEHHLVPRSLKGRVTVTLHRICHTKIHSLFTERELANYYNTIERLLSHDEIQKFVRWVGKKDPEFYDSHRDSSDRSRKRR